MKKSERFVPWWLENREVVEIVQIYRIIFTTMVYTGAEA